MYTVDFPLYIKASHETDVVNFLGGLQTILHLQYLYVYDVTNEEEVSSVPVFSAYHSLEENHDNNESLKIYKVTPDLILDSKDQKWALGL